MSLAGILGTPSSFAFVLKNPYRDFRPGGGLVIACEFPAGPGIRVDAGIQADALQPSRYDSLCAKIIIWGPRSGRGDWTGAPSSE